MVNCQHAGLSTCVFFQANRSAFSGRNVLCILRHRKTLVVTFMIKHEYAGFSIYHFMFPDITMQATCLDLSPSFKSNFINSILIPRRVIHLKRWLGQFSRTDADPIRTLWRHSCSRCCQGTFRQWLDSWNSTEWSPWLGWYHFSEHRASNWSNT